VSRYQVSLLFLAVSTVGPWARGLAQRSDTASAPRISDKVSGLARADGFVPFYVEPRSGSLWLELPKNGARMLLCTSLASGLGSNPVGLDRGESGNCYVARTEPSGRRHLVVLENWGYRSSAHDQPEHTRSVEESFAPSTVASLPVLAESGATVLVDAADLVLRDWRDVRALADAGRASRPGEGAQLRPGPGSARLPLNTEIEAALTFEARIGPAIVRR
jgi:hypothetical protein